ncbi:hypothetical protein SAMD00023519_01848 [Listeria monocytogenes]|nr:hypothetical protein SAMD00023519_01848 [Listeria monocytogenes]
MPFLYFFRSWRFCLNIYFIKINMLIFKPCFCFLTGATFWIPIKINHFASPSDCILLLS